MQFLFHLERRKIGISLEFNRPRVIQRKFVLSNFINLNFLVRNLFYKVSRVTAMWKCPHSWLEFSVLNIRTFYSQTLNKKNNDRVIV